MFDVWKNVLTEIERSVPSSVFQTWLKDLSLVSLNDNQIIIGTTSVFIKTTVEKKYIETIRNALEKNNIFAKDIIFKSDISQKNIVRAREITNSINIRDINTNSERINNINSPNAISSLNHDTNLNPKYTIDNFVTGSNNDLAVSVAKNIIDSPGNERYNPFFLYGGPGLGKTHLVQAIGNELLRKNSKLKILYTPVSHFYSDFINSIRNKKGDEFAKKFQKLDVLIIDDFQGIIGKDASQQQFFEIFNDLYNLNKQIIITSDRLPNQIKDLDERLSSRLAMAGAIDLQLPNFEERCAILKAKSEYMGAFIEDDAVEFIAENIKTNIRDLESEFKRILALSDLRGLTPLQLIESGYMTTSSAGNSFKSTTSKQIIEKVAKFYSLSVKEMCGKSRVFNIKNARQVAMYLLSKELSMSTPKIASEIGVKDHTTVMNGIKRITNDLKTNFSLRDQIEEIKAKIYE